MLYKSQNILSDMLYALSLITTDVKYGTKLKFNDKAKACEHIFAKILTILFDKEYTNCNLIKQDYPAIGFAFREYCISSFSPRQCEEN